MVELTPDRLTAAYMAQVAAIRERVVVFARTLWEATAQLRDADVDRLVARLVPVVQGGQVQVANITSAYVRRLAELEGIVPVSVPVDRATIVGYRGVPPEDVYRRPAVTAYTALSQGKSFQEARAEGMARLVSIVSSDVQQARNRQARAAYSSSGFDYTVRTLSGAENCALCVIASTQRYRLSGLMPIHPGCDCGERGVTAGRDPGQIIDPDLLEATHAQIESKLGYTDRGAHDLLIGKTDSQARPISDFTDLLVTHEHGELGPTLSWRSDRFTSEADIAALH